MRSSDLFSAAPISTSARSKCSGVPTGHDPPRALRHARLVCVTAVRKVRVSHGVSATTTRSGPGACRARRPLGVDRGAGPPAPRCPECACPRRCAPARTRARLRPFPRRPADRRAPWPRARSRRLLRLLGWRRRRKGAHRAASASHPPGREARDRCRRADPRPTTEEAARPVRGPWTARPRLNLSTSARSRSPRPWRSPGPRSVPSGRARQRATARSPWRTPR